MGVKAGSEAIGVHVHSSTAHFLDGEGIRAWGNKLGRLGQ